MIRETAAGLRFGRSWLSGRADVVSEEIELDRGDRSVPATLFTPSRPALPLGGWIALHGATVPGRFHPQLVRFAKSLGHTGAAVVVPEVPEWASLQLAPGLTVPTVRAALPALRRAVGARRPGLMGFSFGGPQAIAAAGDASLRDELVGVAAFGGYCELAPTLRFLFLGEHAWDGRRYHARVDPYGRWIVGANYLHRTPGYEDAVDVADALRVLAAEAGARRVPAWDARYEAPKRELRGRVAPERRALFDVFAPAGEGLPERELAERVMAALVGGIRVVDPLLDPGERLRAVRLPVRLLHGRGDALIPFTETLRMRSTLAGSTDVRATVTGLFAHTQAHGTAGPGRAWEAGRFVRALGGVLRMGAGG